MNILFHVGVGNTDRPERWDSICMFFTKIARSFETLGHNCLLFCHPRAKHKKFIYKHNIISPKVCDLNFNPDKIFTWNGIFDGDQQMIKKYGRENFIFGELGFFDHYETCYFDFSGTNYKSMLMVEDLEDCTEEQYKELKNKYIKPRLFNKKYVFCPLQDETDTQITKLSPFKTMKDFLDYVIDLYNYDDDIKILYKQHPRRPAKVPSHKKLIEVKENVHHYIPYADKVIGINSTVMFETLLYHQRMLNVGFGFGSRRFENDEDRKKFVVQCYNRQIHQLDLLDPNKIKESWFYKKMIGEI